VVEVLQDVERCDARAGEVRGYRDRQDEDVQMALSSRRIVWGIGRLIALYEKVKMVAAKLLGDVPGMKGEIRSRCA